MVVWLCVELSDHHGLQLCHFPFPEAPLTSLQNLLVFILVTSMPTALRQYLTELGFASPWQLEMLNVFYNTVEWHLWLLLRPFSFFFSKKFGQLVCWLRSLRSSSHFGYLTYGLQVLSPIGFLQILQTLPFTGKKYRSLLLSVFKHPRKKLASGKWAYFQVLALESKITIF